MKYIKKNSSLSSNGHASQEDEGPTLTLLYVARKQFNKMEDLNNKCHNQSWAQQMTFNNDENSDYDSKRIQLQQYGIKINNIEQFRLQEDVAEKNDTTIQFQPQMEDIESEEISEERLKVLSEFDKINHTQQTIIDTNQLMEPPQFKIKSLASITGSESFETTPDKDMKVPKGNKTEIESKNMMNAFTLILPSINQKAQDFLSKFDTILKQKETTNLPVDTRKTFLRKQDLESLEEENPLRITFKWKNFIQFFGYHFAYKCLIGPLAPLIFIFIFKQNRELWINMELYGMSRTNLIQVANYFIYIFGLSLFFIMQLKASTLFNFYFLTFLYQYILNCIIDSIKYGFYNSKKVENVTNLIMDSKELSKEYIFGMWAEQCDQIIIEEIETAKQRLEIESSSFYFEFMVLPSKEKLKPLLKESILSNLCKIQNSQLSALPYGQNLLLEYIKYFRINFKMTSLKVIPYALSLLRQAYFFSVKLINILNSVDDVNQRFLLIFSCVLNGILETFFWSAIVRYLLIYNQDLHRKAFILNQISHLISPKKADISLDIVKKLYPTLALVCPVTLRTWANLRRIVLEYGEKYSQRIQIMLSMLGSLIVIVIMVFLLQTMNVITLTLPIEATYLYLFDFSVFTVISIKCISMGGKINEQFSEHIQMLYKNKLIFKELLSKIDLWIKEDFSLTNTLFRKLIEQYRKLKNKMHFSTAQVHQFVEDNIHISSMHILDIEIQSTNNPYKVFGIAMTQKLAFTIFTAFISMIFSLVFQNHYSPTQLLPS